MQTRIQGTVMPVLEVQLDPNDSVYAESGELSWMTASIQMTTHTQMGGGGGLLGMFKRAVGGGSFFMTEYRAVQSPGEVAFATKVPGHIVPVPVGPGSEYMVHRHGFLCATPQVTIGVAVGFGRAADGCLRARPADNATVDRGAGRVPAGHARGLAQGGCGPARGGTAGSRLHAVVRQRVRQL